MPDLLEVTRGDTPTVRVGPVKRDGAPVPLTGSATLTVKADPDDDDPLFQKTGAFVTLEDPDDGAEFVLESADTADLADDYVWDVKVVESDGTVTTFPKRPPGTFRVLADVNRA